MHVSFASDVFSVAGTHLSAFVFGICVMEFYRYVHVLTACIKLSQRSVQTQCAHKVCVYNVMHIIILNTLI